MRELEARPAFASSQEIEDIVGTLEAEIRALQEELMVLRERDSAGQLSAV